MRTRAIQNIGLAVLVAMTAPVVYADTQPYEEYDKRTKGAQQVSPLTDGLFGDSVNLYNGSTDFSQTDIDLPGNDALPVRLTRRMSIEAIPFRMVADKIYGAGGWDVDVPYITGMFDGFMKWNVDVSGQEKPRCSYKFFPGTAPSARIGDIFSGYTIHIPGAGDQSMMTIMDANAPQPADGQVHNWTTRDLAAFGCTSATKNGYPGEGFVMTTADGIKYTFDVALEKYPGPINSMGKSRVRVRIYLLASKIEDRYGHKVEYQYDGAGHPTRIQASDGRLITLTYSNGQLATATANGRTWTYQYTDGWLDKVVQPDGQAWTFSRVGSLRLGTQTVDWRMGPSCSNPPGVDNGSFDLTITHPSGAKGTFEFDHIRHERSGVSVRSCIVDVPSSGGEPPLYSLAVPNFFDVFSLKRKTITGPGIATPSVWTYSYGGGPSDLIGGAPGTCQDTRYCALAKTVTVTDALGIKTEHRFGMRYFLNEGKPLGVRVITPDGVVRRQEIMEYLTDAEAASQPFPDYYASVWGGDDARANYLRPLKRRTIVQDGTIWNVNPDAVAPGPPPPAPSRQPPPDPEPPEPCPTAQCNPRLVAGGSEGSADASVTDAQSGDGQAAVGEPIPIWPVAPTTFTYRVDAFDSWARPTRATRFSSLGDSRTETTAYADNKAKWIIGQVKSVTCTAPASCANQVIGQTDYDANTAEPVRTYAFGKLKQTLTYYSGADATQTGTLASIADGNGNAIKMSGWKRGVPTVVTFPATPEQPGGNTQKVAVDDNGWIDSVTDENNFVTKYDYDPMGQLTLIDYPDGDSVAWTSLTRSFKPSATSYYGLPVGAWYQIVQTGNNRKVTFFDGFWRPVVEDTYDYTDSASIAATRSIVVKRYDARGRLVFQSYPVRSLNTINDALKGVTTAYDALNRPTSTHQDSELGTLTTTTLYEPNFRRKTMNAKGQSTVERFQAFDEPDYGTPVVIDRPDSVRTVIARDVYGKPTEIIRGAQGN